MSSPPRGWQLQLFSSNLLHLGTGAAGTILPGGKHLSQIKPGAGNIPVPSFADPLQEAAVTQAMSVPGAPPLVPVSPGLSVPMPTLPEGPCAGGDVGTLPTGRCAAVSGQSIWHWAIFGTLRKKAQDKCPRGRVGGSCWHVEAYLESSSGMV